MEAEAERALLAFMSELAAIDAYVARSTNGTAYMQAKSVAYGYVSTRVYELLQEVGIPRETVLAADHRGRDNPGWARWDKDDPNAKPNEPMEE